MKYFPDKCFPRKKKSEAIDPKILIYLLQVRPLLNTLLSFNSSPLFIMQSKILESKCFQSQHNHKE